MKRAFSFIVVLKSNNISLDFHIRTILHDDANTLPLASENFPKKYKYNTL